VEHYPTKAISVEALPGTREDITILKLSGPLTIHNFFEFQDLSRRKPEPPVLLVDLTDVPYIDSAALGSLVGIHVSCDRGNRKYALIGPNDRIKSLFTMTGVDRFLVTYGSVAEAETNLV
jgi:anti-sigma B factor antagonist